MKSMNDFVSSQIDFNKNQQEFNKKIMDKFNKQVQFNQNIVNKIDQIDKQQNKFHKCVETRLDKIEKD